jgi:hypothetical protein
MPRFTGLERGAGGAMRVVDIAARRRRGGQVAVAVGDSPARKGLVSRRQDIRKVEGGLAILFEQL